MTIEKCVKILLDLYKGASENSQQSTIMAEYEEAFKVALDALAAVRGETRALSLHFKHEASERRADDDKGGNKEMKQSDRDALQYIRGGLAMLKAINKNDKVNDELDYYDVTMFDILHAENEEES